MATRQIYFVLLFEHIFTRNVRRELAVQIFVEICSQCLFFSLPIRLVDKKMIVIAINSMICG